MKTAAIIAGVVLALLPIGCPSPAPPRPMPPDAADGAPLAIDASVAACDLACKQLALFCAEGASPQCFGRLSAIDMLRTEPNRAKNNDSLQCGDFAAVRSAADVVAMGQKCSPLGD